MYATIKRAQPRALRIIENSIKNNRLSHAYLFTGPKGTYKKEMAYHLAMSLYCQEEVPCYNCPNCLAILENRHLNVHYIEPFGQTIKKEQIIALQEEFSKTSLLPGPRIYIINEADTMSSSAANSLLKFIEEPNGETYGILITEHKDNMLSTIISRSMIVTFDELDKRILREELSKLSISEVDKDCITHLTSNLADANLLIDDENVMNIFRVFESFVDDLASKKNVCLFYRNNLEALANKDRLKVFLLLLESFLRDVYEYKKVNKVLVFESLEEKIKELSLNISDDNLLKYIFLILELTKKIGYNVNMSLLINQFLIDINGGI
jgi:DNA polymerase-3 subunit delta'